MLNWVLGIEGMPWEYGGWGGTNGTAGDQGVWCLGKAVAAASSIAEVF